MEENDFRLVSDHYLVECSNKEAFVMSYNPPPYGNYNANNSWEKQNSPNQGRPNSQAIQELLKLQQRQIQQGSNVLQFPFLLFHFFKPKKKKHIFYFAKKKNENVGNKQSKEEQIQSVVI